MPASRQPSHLALNVDRLRGKLDDIARQSGIREPDRRGMGEMLQAMPYRARRRAALAMEAARLGGQLSQDKGVVAAADYVLTLARDVWRDGEEAGLPRSMREGGAGD